MKRFFIIVLLLLFSNNLFIYSQEVSNQKYKPDKPNYFIPKNHDANYLKLKKLPSKSFYESKSEWQHIIDSTWGAGDPLSQKLLIYNTFAQKVRNEFDGFLSLQLNWDSLYNFYLSKITDSTSKGAFSSIMSHFAYDLKDFHTRSYDKTVVLTPLNPGVPILLLGSYISVEHFGAVTTILPDSTTLVLRVVPNHPLNLEPGDIILGYEGIPWKNLIAELLNFGLPMIATTGGCRTADIYLNLIGAGLNWHLFNTIDILKYSTGDTLHLSVLPLLNLNVPPFVNNEQLPIANIPFPTVLPVPIVSDTVVTYGILEGTNIGYIYLAEEYPEATADAQFYEAVNYLKNTDALIIDMRLNFGGWAFFTNAFKILFNDFYSTIEDAYRCNINTFDLCPSGNWQTFKVVGESPLYDRPIAVMLGPTCVSMGDLTAQRLRYHPMVRFFGASSNASLGDNRPIENFPNWLINYSVGDMFHTNNPGVYLNRREFPIDFPVWHNRDDVALGKDAVVEKALQWINNVVYPHNTITNKIYFSTPEDTVLISTVIENPNSHQLSARAYIKSIDNAFVDSVDLEFKSSASGSEQWSGNLSVPIQENFYKVAVTSFDETASDHFTVPNATRFTTAGPVIVDSLYAAFQPAQSRFAFRPYLRNLSTEAQILNPSVTITCNDSMVTNITQNTLTAPTILPEQRVSCVGATSIYYDPSKVKDTLTFNIHFEIYSDGFVYWNMDTTVSFVITDIEEELMFPTSYKLEQNYPNPFNPSTIISWQSPVSSWQTLKVFDVLGNEIATLIDEYKPAGRYGVEFSASTLPSGVYFYQLRASEFIQTKKMLLLK